MQTGRRPGLRHPFGIVKERRYPDRLLEKPAKFPPWTSLNPGAEAPRQVFGRGIDLKDTVLMIDQNHTVSTGINDRLGLLSLKCQCRYSPTQIYAHGIKRVRELPYFVS
jgi:hypothetical protein